MGFLISQLRSSEGVFAHVSMYVHRGVTEHSCACACASGCDQMGTESVERHRDRQTHDPADRKIDRGTND